MTAGRAVLTPLTVVLLFGVVLTANGLLLAGTTSATASLGSHVRGTRT